MSGDLMNVLIVGGLDKILKFGRLFHHQEMTHYCSMLGLILSGLLSSICLLTGLLIGGQLDEQSYHECSDCRWFDVRDGG